MGYRIFLSHSERDRNLVQAIKANVEAIGVSVYLYEEHSAPGAALTPHLQRAIKHQDALVALMTPDSAPRSYVQQEIGYALGLGKPAVALVTSGVDEDALAMLGDRQYIKLDPSDPLHGMADLIRDLHDRAGRKEQEELIRAVVLVSLLLIVAYMSTQTVRTS